MMPEDVPVWERWLDLHQPGDDVTISYDVKVGTPIKLPEDFPDPYRRNALMLSKKRIDAVVTYPSYILIVEVKGIADWTAIGQMLGYPFLFAEEFKPTMELRTLLVAGSVRPDVDRILEAYGIPFELV